ncbi:MAG: ROK family protein, partial [Pseudomonadota bacterium]|nr:ROK family protein [Pseudomonadota bacterium]
MQTNKRQRARSKEAVVASLAEILTLIRLGRANTRLGIEESSEYGRAIVADRLATLTDLGLVHENAAGESTRGRTPRLVQFCADRARIFVATLGSNSIGAGLVDLDGNLVTEHHETADLAERPDEIV